MSNENIPKVPAAGIIYGRICYWIVLVGIVISVIGMIMYFTSDGYIDRVGSWEAIWAGEEKDVIWETHCVDHEVAEGHWYFGQLGDGDGLAFLGVAICGVAAIFGMWAAFVVMDRKKEKVYSIFALIVSIILTLGAIGIISTH